MITGDEFQRTMSTRRIGSPVSTSRSARKHSVRGASRCSPPATSTTSRYTSSPGDSSIGMNVAAAALQGYSLQFDECRRQRDRVHRPGRSGAVSALRSSAAAVPRTAPRQSPRSRKCSHRREGARLLPQFTDARPDTGGLSGATPAEPSAGARSIRPTARCCGLLYRCDDRDAAAHGLRPDPTRAARAQRLYRRRGRCSTCWSEYELSDRNE